MRVTIVTTVARPHNARATILRRRKPIASEGAWRWTSAKRASPGTGTRPGTAWSATLDGESPPTPVVDLPRRAGRRARLHRADRGAEPRSAARASSTTSSAAARASTCRTRPPSSGRRSSSRTSSSAHAAPRHRRPPRRRRAVMGRDARDGVRARPSGRPPRHRRRRLAREHGAVGRRRRTGSARTSPPRCRRR